MSKNWGKIGAGLTLLGIVIGMILSAFTLSFDEPTKYFVITCALLLGVFFWFQVFKEPNSVKESDSRSDVPVEQTSEGKGTSFKREIHTEIENMLDKFKGEFENWRYSQSKVVYSVWKNKDEKEKDDLLGTDAYFLLRTAYAKIASLNEYLDSHQGMLMQGDEIMKLDSVCLLAFKEACVKVEWLKDLAKVCEYNISKLGY